MSIIDIIMHTNTKKKSAITNYFSKLNVDTDAISDRSEISSQPSQSAELSTTVQNQVSF